jgi:hypothetical protein
MPKIHMQIETNHDCIVATGSTEDVIDCLFGPRQYDAHMKGWRWHQFTRGAEQRAASVDEAVRKLIAARRVTNVPTLMPHRVAARHMQAGDVIGSGETVVRVSAGVRTPRGKVEVLLDRGGRRRLATWGAYTVINVQRAA